MCSKYILCSSYIDRSNFTILICHPPMSPAQGASHTHLNLPFALLRRIQCSALVRESLIAVYLCYPMGWKVSGSFGTTETVVGSCFLSSRLTRSLRLDRFPAPRSLCLWFCRKKERGIRTSKRQRHQYQSWRTWHRSRSFTPIPRLSYSALVLLSRTGSFHLRELSPARVCSTRVSLLCAQICLTSFPSDWLDPGKLSIYSGASYWTISTDGPSPPHFDWLCWPFVSWARREHPCLPAPTARRPRSMNYSLRHLSYSYLSRAFLVVAEAC